MSRRARAAMLAIAVFVAACGTPGPTASPASSSSPAATPAPSATRSASVTPSASPTPSPTPSASLTAGGLRWLSLAGIDSARVVVPLDYRNPSAGTIALAVVRRQVADPAKRIGTLFLNPGGPGGSGVAMLAGASGALPQGVVDRFDLVSWDPRGVGFSRGVTCPDRATIAKVEALDPSPTTAADIAAYRTAFGQVATQCEAAAGDILPYLAGANTARDMDAIRAAMGEATISYWGWSYGTYLGYLYATLFPTRLRAAVLDGPVDPTLDLAGRDDGQARGFEAAFNRELALCAGSKTCPFYNGGDPAKAYAALMARLETAPIPVTGLGTLGPGEATTGVITSLYGGDPQTTMQALAEAQRGDGQGLLEMANAYYAQIQLGSYLATACLDVAREPTTAAIDQVLARTSAAAPRFAAQVVLTDAYGCLDWPVAADPVHVGAPPSGLPPILVLAATYDPATPPWGAEPLARALGTGVVVMRDGLGHTSDGSIRSNTCLGDAATSYLLGLVTPKPGLLCKDAPVTFGP